MNYTFGSPGVLIRALKPPGIPHMQLHFFKHGSTWMNHVVIAFISQSLSPCPNNGELEMLGPWGPNQSTDTAQNTCKIAIKYKV